MVGMFYGRGYNIILPDFKYLQATTSYKRQQVATNKKKPGEYKCALY